MGREIQRSYLPTPELLKDGVRISTVPINLAAGDWNGLNRLLETMRKAIIEPQGTITGRTFRTAVEPDKRVQIDTANGIRIYDSGNNLVAQFDGDELTILGGTITGATFQTAASPAQRVEITTASGIRLYDATNTLTAQLNGADILLNNVYSLAAPTTFTTLGAGGVSFATSSTYRGTFSSNGLLITSPRIAFNTYTSADVGISSSGTTLLIGKADGSSFADLEARTITATSSFVGALTGAVTGNVTGNLTGNVTGNLTGDVTGNITGNLNITGSHGPIITGSSQVQLGINKADGGTDQKRFEALWYTGGTFALRFVNDAYTLADEILNVTQTAGSYLIDHITIPQDVVVTGTLSATGTAFGISIQYLDWASNPQTLSF